METATIKLPTAIVYKLTCSDNYYYIGSTISELRFRFSNHKQDSVKYPDRPVYAHINQLGWNNVKAEVIEKYPCNTRQELYQREDYYIQKAKQENDSFCLNLKRANVTPEERRENVKKYYEENREDILVKAKEYRDTHKEEINEYFGIYRIAQADKRNEYSKKYREEHLEQVTEQRHKHYEENKEKYAENSKKYYEEHKEEITEYKKKWTEENKERLQEKSKEYREEHKEEIKEKGKQYYEENKEAILERNKQLYEKNKEKYLAHQKEYREKNKEKIASHANEDISCPCGGKYKRHHKSTHEKSAKHQKHSTTKSS